MEQRIIKREAYHIQVYEIVKNQILSRKLPSGEKINENALAQSLGVSRSPVREALRMLEQDELVVPSSSGLIVNPLNVENMKDVYECRMVLESYAARLSAAALSAEDLQKEARFHMDAEAAESVPDALRKAVDYADENNLAGVVVCGSLYLAAEARPWLLKEAEK